MAARHSWQVATTAPPAWRLAAPAHRVIRLASIASSTGAQARAGPAPSAHPWIAIDQRVVAYASPDNVYSVLKERIEAATAFDIHRRGTTSLQRKSKAWLLGGTSTEKNPRGWVSMDH